MSILVDLEVESGRSCGLILSMKNKPRSSAERVAGRGSQSFQALRMFYSQDYSLRSEKCQADQH